MGGKAEGVVVGPSVAPGLGLVPAVGFRLMLPVGTTLPPGARGVVPQDAPGGQDVGRDALLVAATATGVVGCVGFVGFRLVGGPSVFPPFSPLGGVEG